jgi:hypothetical protein
MSVPNRELGAFARAVEALKPYLDELVFAGGWANYLYTVLPEAAPLGFEPLRTEDADIAAPLRLDPERSQSLRFCPRQGLSCSSLATTCRRSRSSRYATTLPASTSSSSRRCLGAR